MSGARAAGRKPLELPAEPAGGSAWDMRHASVDWLTVRQRNLGRWPVVNAGCVLELDVSGEVLWTKRRALRVVGSFETSAQLLVTDEWLVLSFNPSRWSRADNVFGVSFEEAIAISNGVLAGRELAPLLLSGSSVELSDGSVLYSGAVVTRLDVSLNLQCGAPGLRDAYLRSLRAQALRRSRTRCWKGSVYFERAAVQVVCYDKGAELAEHNPASAELAAFCNAAGVVRTEVRFRREFLRAHNLRQACRVSTEVLVSEANKVLDELPREVAELDVSSLTRSELGSFLMWRGGFDVRGGMSRRLFYAHRRAIKSKIGFDIGGEAPIKFEPKALAFRVTELVPPDWYVMPDGRPYVLHKADAEAKAAGQLFLLPTAKPESK